MHVVVRCGIIVHAGLLYHGSLRCIGCTVMWYILNSLKLHLENTIIHCTHYQGSHAGFHLEGGAGGNFPPTPSFPPKEKEKEREKEREREGDRREVREQHIFGYYDIIRK